MLEYLVYIDTREGQGSFFSPPAEVENYGTWLTDAYNKAHFADGSKQCAYGIAQRINQITFRSHSELRKEQDGQAPDPFSVHCYGPYAGQAAKALITMGVAAQHVEVLG